MLSCEEIKLASLKARPEDDQATTREEQEAIAGMAVKKTIISQVKRSSSLIIIWFFIPFLIQKVVMFPRLQECSDDSLHSKAFYYKCSYVLSKNFFFSNSFNGIIEFS